MTANRWNVTFAHLAENLRWAEQTIEVQATQQFDAVWRAQQTPEYAGNRGAAYSFVLMVEPIHEPVFPTVQPLRGYLEAIHAAAARLAEGDHIVSALVGAIIDHARGKRP